MGYMCSNAHKFEKGVRQLLMPVNYLPITEGKLFVRCGMDDGDAIQLVSPSEVRAIFHTTFVLC